MSALDLLFELGTEELPPRALPSLSTALTEGVALGLDAAGIPHGRVQGYATPRARVRTRRMNRCRSVTDTAWRASSRLNACEAFTICS